jgi:excisionase family DNA binding protein
MELMDVDVVAKLLKLSRSKVYKMAENVELQSVKFGKSLRFSEEQVKSLISDNIKGGKE